MTTPQKYESHALADLFPLLEGAEFAELVADIKAHDLRQAVLLYENRILDGRNRYRACREAGVACRFKTYDGNDPLAEVIALNLVRRHLNESQRGAVGAKIGTLPHGGDRKSDQAANLHLAPTRAQTAKRLNVSERTIASAAAVLAKSPELFKAVERGQIPVSAAAKIADTPPEFQHAVIKKIGDGAADTTTEAIRQVRRETKKTVSAPTGKYRVIYADPPWDYGNSGLGGEFGYGHASYHYPTMPLDELCALPIRAIAEDGSVLFLWATSPFAEDAFKVVNAWGFKYKAQFVWYKLKHNFGYYNSVRHELLYIATRGSCLPDAAQLINSVQSIERSGKHSQKPAEFRTIIETLYPHGSRIELFAREKVAGWEAWGNEPDASAHGDEAPDVATLAA